MKYKIILDNISDFNIVFPIILDLNNGKDHFSIIRNTLELNKKVEIGINNGYSGWDEPIQKSFEDYKEINLIKFVELFGKEQSKRYNSGKVEFDDIPMLGIIEVAKAGVYGRKKYGKQNWRKSAPTSQYLNCAFRHLLKYMYGETHDQESGCHHLGHAAWNILALLEKIITKNDDDDRFKYDNELDMESIFKVKEEE